MPNTPTTLCRQQLVLGLLRDATDKRFLEIGTGEGELLAKLAARGFTGESVDISETAVERARGFLEGKGVEGITVSLGDLYRLERPWPLVFAFEVLEHLDDDEAALRQLRRLVLPGGRLLFSVPAHMDMWGPSDESVGHVRRYERAELESKLDRAGFDLEELWSAAVPVADVLSRIGKVLNARRISRGAVDGSRLERTKASSMDRVVPATDRTYDLLFNRFTLAPAFLLQTAFLNTDLGTGFVGAARARTDESG